MPWQADEVIKAGIGNDLAAGIIRLSAWNGSSTPARERVGEPALSRDVLGGTDMSESLVCC